jgi:membrane fusion protein (multidrug efflux system)
MSLNPSPRAEQPSRPTRPADAPLRPAPGTERRPLFRRPLVLLLAAVLLVAAIVGGVLWWLDARRYESTDDAFIDAHMGRVAPQVPGRVLHVLVTDNQPVTPGQPILEIDPVDLQAKLDQATANETQAAAALAQAKAQLAVSQANTEEAQAQVAVAEANAINAATQLKRDQALAAQQVVSRQQLDNDTANARSTGANLAAAQKRVVSAQAQEVVAAAQVAAAEANLKAASAQLEQARLNRSYAQIAAAETGRVAHINVAVGDYVQAGQNLMALVPSRIWITANFKETQLDLMRPGQPVAIHVDAYPEKIFHGHVDSLQPGSGAVFSLLPPENATGNYVKVVQRVPVKIVFDDPADPDRPLGPGMSVEPQVTVR